ncbi:MAG: hypothetical protein WDZ44_00735 [Candidatus Spechtbacterales bacterium]
MYTLSFLRLFTANRPAMVSGGLMGLIVVLVGAYLISATAVMRADFSIQQKQSELADAKRETIELQIRFAEVGSLQQILDRSASLSYTNAGQVYYIERAPSTAVAVR